MCHLQLNFNITWPDSRLFRNPRKFYSSFAAREFDVPFRALISRAASSFFGSFIFIFDNDIYMRMFRVTRGETGITKIEGNFNVSFVIYFDTASISISYFNSSDYVKFVEFFAFHFQW